MFCVRISVMTVSCLFLPNKCEFCLQAENMEYINCGVLRLENVSIRFLFDWLVGCYVGYLTVLHQLKWLCRIKQDERIICGESKCGEESVWGMFQDGARRTQENHKISSSV
jgi:hypothetical protein